jgi:hypothetical protein
MQRPSTVCPNSRMPQRCACAHKKKLTEGEEVFLERPLEAAASPGRLILPPPILVTEVFEVVQVSLLLGSVRPIVVVPSRASPLRQGILPISRALGPL